MTFISRPYRGDSDLGRMLDLARAVAAGPAPPCRRPGDLVWMLRPHFDPTTAVRLWDEGGPALAGWSAFESPDEVLFETRAGLDSRANLLGEMFAWAEFRADEAGVAALATPIHAGDAALLGLAEGRGLRRIPGREEVLFRRSLTTAIPAAALPDGFRVRHATVADTEERVACHRDAWSVWGPSSYSEEAHAWLRAAPEFDETLDLVVEAPGGQLVSCCILWADGANRCGHFEPVGTRPAFAGRGLARAMLDEGMRRLRDRGCDMVYVSTAGHNARARALYPSLGFEQFETAHWVAAAHRRR